MSIKFLHNLVPRNFLGHLLISYLILNCMPVQALDVVYPASTQKIINAQSTFFIGSVKKGASLKINGESVKIWNDSFFVQYVPLLTGLNTFELTETYKGKKKNLIYKISKSKPENSPPVELKFYPKEEGTYLYTKTLNNNSTVREKPSVASKRITELPKGTVLYLEGKKGSWYKLEEQTEREFWIHESNLETPKILNNRIYADVFTPIETSDKLYNYFKIPVTYPVMYELVQEDKSLSLTLYGVKNKNLPDSKIIKYTFEYDRPITGYDVIYEDEKLVLRRGKIADKVNPYRPLYGVRIFIDAGHGGSEKGAVGPSRVCEKDINLLIAKKIIKKLEKEGAIVSYSRIDDKNVPLYDRVNMAKENNAFISLSIHNNALPDGKNPYVTHGIETHYYNENAKELALTIKNNLVKDLNIKDNGIHNSSFVLTRASNPISVLIEAAYMINPSEYILLQTNDFQEKIADSVVKSLKEYMILLKK